MSDELGETVNDEVIRLASVRFGVDPGNVSRESHLYVDFGIQPYHLERLIGSLEEKYGIEISYDDGQEFQTVGQVADYVAKRISEDPTSS
jgi:acyl carrier protein